MGGNSSSRLDSFESDDSGGVTIVKGVRLTDRVIDRMKESPRMVPQRPQPQKQAHPPIGQPTAPPGQTCSPGEGLVPILPHPPSFASSLVPPALQEPVPALVPLASVTPETPSPGSSSTPSAEVVPPPSPVKPSAQEHVAIPLPMEPGSVTSSQPTKSAAVTAAPPVEAVATSPSTAAESSEPVVTPTPPHVEAVIPPPSTESTAIPVTPLSPLSDPPTLLEELVPPQSSSALAVPSELPSVGQIEPPPTEETPVPPSSAPTAEPAVSPVLPHPSEEMSTLTCPVKPHAAVNEDELRQQIKDELQKQLQEEMKVAELEVQQQLEEEKGKAKAEAEAKARLQIQAEVQKALEEEQISLQQSLKDAVMKQRMSTEDERLVAQYYWMERKIQKLEEKDRDLAKQDLLYKEQITKLEEKTAQFTRVTAESFKKGLEDARNHFKKNQIKPVCSELQSEILKCYRENTGQTLTCSNIASLYMQCVDNAKQNKKASTGG